MVLEKINVLLNRFYDGKMFNNLNLIPETNNLALNRFTYLVDDLASASLKGVNYLDDLDNFIKLFGKFNELDTDEFADAMMKAFNGDSFGSASKHTEDSVKEAIQEMKKTYNRR